VFVIQYSMDGCALVREFAPAMKKGKALQLILHCPEYKLA